MNKKCLIYDIRFDKKANALTATLFIESPRELLVNVPYKELMLRVRNEGYEIADSSIVSNSLFEVIQKHLLKEG